MDNPGGHGSPRPGDPPDGAVIGLPDDTDLERAQYVAWADREAAGPEPWPSAEEDAEPWEQGPEDIKVDGPVPGGPHWTLPSGRSHVTNPTKYDV